MYLYSYNQGSVGARNLAQALGIRRIRHQNSSFVGRGSRTVINWGCSDLPEQVRRCNVLNTQEAVRITSNKRHFFDAINQEDSINKPENTNSYQTALNWVQEGNIVVARTVLTGHSGNGIVLMDRDNVDTLSTQAPLYTKYIKKIDEYRVHIVGGRVIDVQRKAKREGYEDADYRIRSYHNGFVYIRGNVSIPTSAQDMCVRTINCLGLDFGAVDIIYNARQDTYYVLEVNTAPGLEGTTVQNYANAMREEYA